MYTSIDVVAGAQFGSESKGRVAAQLVRDRAEQNPNQPVVSIRVGGPNAGHVVVGKGGEHFAMRQVPVGFIEPSALLYIAAGSEVDFDVLDAEVEMLEGAGYSIRDRLYLDPEATVLEPAHIEQEKKSDLVQRLGSTAKGIGAARADRIWRTARRVSDLNQSKYLEHNVLKYLQAVHEPAVVIEGTQGYGLGLHAGFYPQCTSGDCRGIDFLAQAGVMPWEVADPSHLQIHLVVRPFPIRVAGNSGPMGEEVSWDELGLTPELTTVTQKVRRVAKFDLEAVRAAVEGNGPSQVRLHLAMGDQVDPMQSGRGSHYDQALRDVYEAYVMKVTAGESWEGLEELQSLLSILYQLTSLAPVDTVGTGPDSQINVKLPRRDVDSTQPADKE